MPLTPLNLSGVEYAGHLEGGDVIKGERGFYFLNTVDCYERPVCEMMKPEEYGSLLGCGGGGGGGGEGEEGI